MGWRLYERYSPGPIVLTRNAERTAMAEVPAIVVGSGLSVLGALRLLGRAGVRAYVFGVPQIERHSRWYRPAPGSDPLTATPDRLAAYLASTPVERAALIPASDAAVRAIATLPPELRKRFPASVPSLAIADQLCDKAQFADLLERIGIDGPLTRRVDTLADLSGLPEPVFAGAFLKPADSARFMARFGAKGFRVTSRDDALAKAAPALAEGIKLVLQEYVPFTREPEGKGPRGDHVLIDGFVDRSGVIRGMLARRRLRMYPPEFGNTTHMVSIPLREVPGPVDALGRIVAHLGHRGIFSGEFKQDPRDGKYKLLEINSRVWWFVEYAGRCGLDVCAMSYLDALDERVPDVPTYKLGAKFVHAYYDWHAVRTMRDEGRLGLIAAVRSIAGAQEPFFNWTDPLPAVRDALGHLDLFRRFSRTRRETA